MDKEFDVEVILGLVIHQPWANKPGAIEEVTERCRSLVLEMVKRLGISPL